MARDLGERRLWLREEEARPVGSKGRMSARMVDPCDAKRAVTQRKLRLREWWSRGEEEARMVGLKDRVSEGRIDPCLAKKAE